MPPRLRSAADPREWLRHARSNLARCREAVVGWAEKVVEAR